MYLVIAEKPSVSKAIAEVIGASKKEEGYLEGKGCIVSWCFGPVSYTHLDVYKRQVKHMAYVSVPKDLTKVKNKVAFNLTKRQLICIGIGAATISNLILIFFY